MKQRAILLFWLPLAFSWLLMTFEGPWVQGVISRKPEAELQLAAFGLVMSLSVTIEAPVIMLLATGSALARDRHAFRVLWRYMMMVNVVVTVVALLMAFTPLLDLYLGRLIGIPPDIIEATRPGMGVMVLWSALIGYRRFHQGVLIRSGHTRVVGVGTVLRILASAGVALLLGAFTELPGAIIGAWALISAVAVEAFYTHYAARRDVGQLLQVEPDPNRRPLTYLAALRFHLPLALTSLMMLLVRPVIESGLAGTTDAARALAAWPVVFAILLVMRAGGLALQEVVIALNDGPEALRALRRFTWGMGLGLSLFMLVFAFTPLLDLYTGVVLGIPEALLEPVALGTRAGVLLPLLTTLQSYLRARLMLAETTGAIYQAMLLSFVATAASVRLGVALGLPGLLAAALALTLGSLLEAAYLSRALAQSLPQLRPA